MLGRCDDFQRLDSWCFWLTGIVGGGGNGLDLVVYGVFLGVFWGYLGCFPLGLEFDGVPAGVLFRWCPLRGAAV